MTETLLQFGAAHHLVGTLTTPSTKAGPGKIGLVLFNAGLIPRQGPHRMNVKIARRLAQIGISSLRFDLSGLGDSLSAGAGGAMDERSVADISAAIDTLVANGVERIGVVGLCSGTDHCIAATLADKRISIMVLLDPWAFPTWRTHLNFALRRYHYHGSWPKFSGAVLRDLTRIVKSRLIPGGAAGGGAAIDVRIRPPQQAFAADIATLLERKVAIYVVYTLGYPSAYNYAGQFNDGFARYGITSAIQSDFLPDATHTFTELTSQSALLERLDSWFRRLPGGQAGV